MNVVLVVLAILVGIVVAVILPWGMLRKLEGRDDGKDDSQ